MQGVQICTKVKCVNLWLFAREGAEIPLRLLLQQVVIDLNNKQNYLNLVPCVVKPACAISIETWHRFEEEKD